MNKEEIKEIEGEMNLDFEYIENEVSLWQLTKIIKDIIKQEVDVKNWLMKM